MLVEIAEEEGGVVRVVGEKAPFALLASLEATGRIFAAMSDSTGVVKASLTVSAKPALRAVLTNRIARIELPPRRRKSSEALILSYGRASTWAYSFRRTASGSS